MFDKLDHNQSSTIQIWPSCALVGSDDCYSFRHCSRTPRTVGDFVPGFEASAWVLGVGAPKSTPPEIIEKPQ